MSGAGADGRPSQRPSRVTRRPAAVAGSASAAAAATDNAAADTVSANAVSANTDAASPSSTAASGPALETELKFSLRGAAAIQRWPEALRLPSGLRLGPPRDWLAEELYLDSPDLRLLRRGAACRLRFLDDGSVRVGLKALGAVAGSRHERWELEATLTAGSGSAAALDPAAWPVGPRQALAELLGEAPDEGLPPHPGQPARAPGDRPTAPSPSRLAEGGREKGAGRRLKRRPALSPLVALSHHRRLWPLVAAPEPAEPPGAVGAVAAVDAIDEAGVIAKGRATTSAKVPKAARKLKVSESPDAPLLAELALDRVWVRAPRQSGAAAGVGQPLAACTELELERLAADDDAWTALERALDGAKGLRPQKRSKLERALRALAEQVPAWVPGGPMPTGADAAGFSSAASAGAEHPILTLPARAAVRLVLRRPLLDLALAEAALRPLVGVEPVHRCRVAARRLSGLLRLLRPLLPRRLGRGRVWLALRDLRRDLAAVRDRDIALEQLTGWLKSRSGGGGASPLGQEAARLQAAWVAEREAAAAALLARLDDPERRRLYRRLRRWTDLDRTERALGEGGPTLAALLPGFLAPRLAALEEGLAALGGGWTAGEGEASPAGDAAAGEAGEASAPARPLVDAPAPQLHDLRLRGKGLRDALRPFRAGLTEEGLRALASLEAAVDHLGRLQDGAAAGQLLQDAHLPAAFEAPLLAALAEEDLQLRAGLTAVLQPLCAPTFAARLLEAWT